MVDVQMLVAGRVHRVQTEICDQRFWDQEQYTMYVCLATRNQNRIQFALTGARYGRNIEVKVNLKLMTAGRVDEQIFRQFGRQIVEHLGRDQEHDEEAAQNCYCKK